MRHTKFFVLAFTTIMFALSGNVWTLPRHSFLQPRMFLGVDGGYFRISLERFEDVYSSRWGPVYGAHGGINVYSAYYLTVKYRTFERNGKKGIHPKSGKNLSNAKWMEDWYTFGLRIHPWSGSVWGSYYGFGYAFYSLEEKSELSVYNDNGGKKKGGGFYLDIGVERFITRRAVAFLELEVASGGIGGRSGLEGQSIGGYFISGGFTLWLF